MCAGRYVKLDWAAFSGQSALPSSSAKIVVTLPAGLPGGRGAGVVYLEVVRGSMVSQPKVPSQLLAYVAASWLHCITGSRLQPCSIVCGQHAQTTPAVCGRCRGVLSWGCCLLR